MSRRLKDSSNGESLTADPVTAHTFSKPVITPPGYRFATVSSNNELDCLLPLLASTPKAYYTSTLLEITLAEARKRADNRAAVETVRYPQDSTSQTDGQQAV
jgi:hypothetical protein